MKKTYMAPKMEEERMTEMLPLCISGVGGTGGGVDAGYGGIDDGGTLEPAIKEMVDFGDEPVRTLW